MGDRAGAAVGGTGRLICLYSDDEWALVAPYLTLRTADAPQREHRHRQTGLGGMPILGRADDRGLRRPDQP